MIPSKSMLMAHPVILVGVGVYIVLDSGEESYYSIRLKLKTTNNEAKYEALWAGLIIARMLRAVEV